jgi:hypothetical protein
MGVDSGRLKSYKQLIQDIEDLDCKMKEVHSMDDLHVLKNVLDIEDEVLSESVLKDMLEVTEAYRVTIAQLINKDIDNKAGALDKLKLRNDGKN